MKFIHLFFRFDVNSFPMHGVRAMGQKLEGKFGSSIDGFLPSSFIIPIFHVSGMEEEDQHLLYSLRKACVN